MRAPHNYEVHSSRLGDSKTKLGLHRMNENLKVFDEHQVYQIS